MRILILTICLMLTAQPAWSQTVEEPSGYRMEDYDAPVPETMTGAHTVNDEAAYALWLSGRITIIDVMPDLPRPANLPTSVLWTGRKRYSIPGAIWLAYAGFGELSAPETALFKADLEQLTGGDKTAPILFLCRADCWMSWNASKRAVSFGYQRVFWYRDGTTGWTFWDWPVKRLRRPKKPK